jgi:predicted kinase
MTMHRSVVLIRGLPGAGKTSLAKVLSGGVYPVFSIDSYFTRDGVYKFKHDENHLAYRHCQEQTAEAMRSGTPMIFVDNTFTLEWEMEPYFALAGRYGYRVFVVTVENRHKGVNSHGVSDEQIEKMAEKYKVKLR